jgi:hypothetical protein
VPGGGLSLDGERWIACRPGFFLPVRVLSRLFRRLVLEKLAAAHRAGQLQFFGKHTALTNAQVFAAYLAPLRNREWVVYSKRPFGGPAEVLRYLARYTHRVAISNRRLVALNDKGVTFKWKDYRLEGQERYGVMTLDTNEFIRRFLMHVLPQGFHRIRYYGLPTSPTGAYPRAARSAAPPDRRHQGRHHKARRAETARASLPMLRLPHAHYRDLLAGATTQAPFKPRMTASILGRERRRSDRQLPWVRDNWSSLRESSGGYHVTDLSHCLSWLAGTIGGTPAGATWRASTAAC